MLNWLKVSELDKARGLITSCMMPSTISAVSHMRQENMGGRGGRGGLRRSLGRLAEGGRGKGGKGVDLGVRKGVYHQLHDALHDACHHWLQPVTSLLQIRLGICLYACIVTLWAPIVGS